MTSTVDKAKKTNDTEQAPSAPEVWHHPRSIEITVPGYAHGGTRVQIPAVHVPPAVYAAAEALQVMVNRAAKAGRELGLEKNAVASRTAALEHEAAAAVTAGKDVPDMRAKVAEINATVVQAEMAFNATTHAQNEALRVLQATITEHHEEWVAYLKGHARRVYAEAAQAADRWRGAANQAITVAGLINRLTGERLQLGHGHSATHIAPMTRTTAHVQSADTPMRVALDALAQELLPEERYDDDEAANLAEWL